MHELGLCDGIVQTALARARGRRVVALRVRIGGHAVDAAVVRQGVELAATGTVVEHAALDLVMTPMRLHCNKCGDESALAAHLPVVACRRCGDLDVELTGDDDVVLESITVEVANLSNDTGRPDNESETPPTARRPA